MQIGITNTYETKSFSVCHNPSINLSHRISTLSPQSPYAVIYEHYLSINEI